MDVIRFLYQGRHYVVEEHDEEKDEVLCYWVGQHKVKIRFKIKELEIDKNFEFLN